MKTRRLWQHTAHEEALSQLFAPCLKGVKSDFFRCILTRQATLFSDYAAVISDTMQEPWRSVSSVITVYELLQLTVSLQSNYRTLKGHSAKHHGVSQSNTTAAEAASHSSAHRQRNYWP